MKQVVIVKPGTLKPKDKEKLYKAGNIVIEHEKPLEVTFKTLNEQADNYVFSNCSSCGERIYVLSERLSALKSGKKLFYCSHGHSQHYL